MNQLVLDPSTGGYVPVKRSLAEIKWYIIFEFCYIVLVVASVAFLTRLQRLLSFILVAPAVGILIIAVTPSKNLHKTPILRHQVAKLSS